MSTQPFLGEIMQIGFNFAPRSWALCDGQLLPIAQNTALFSLLGTAFGGDGRTTFALPDLRGRVAKNVGTGAGLDTVTWGERGGTELINILIANMPSHNHTMYAQADAGNIRNPTGSYLSGDSGGDFTWWNSAQGGTKNLVATNNESIGNTGGNIPIDVRNPFLGIYHCIALDGIFPSRS